MTTKRKAQRRRPVERVVFSIDTYGDRTRTFKSFRVMLSSNGIEDVQREHSPYEGHFGLSVPKRDAAKTRKLVFII